MNTKQNYECVVKKYGNIRYEFDPETGFHYCIIYTSYLSMPTFKTHISGYGLTKEKAVYDLCDTLRDNILATVEGIT